MSNETETLRELPSTTRELIQLLNEYHPHRCIAIGESAEEAGRYAGARDLIDELIVWQEEQDEHDASTTRH